MKSSKNISLLILAVVLTLGLASGVSAAINCNITSITRISQFTQLNVSYNVTLDGTTSNVSVAFELRDTTNHINSSYSVIGNITNTSNLRHANMTFGNNIIFPDADNADLRARCYHNGTSSVVDNTLATAVTGIEVDRSAPVTQGLSSAGSSRSGNLYTITFGVVNATRWRLFHNSVVVQTTAVTSDIANSSEQSQQISLRDSGSYYVETFDGTNTTNSETISYTLAGKLIKSAVSTPAQKVVEKQKIIEKEDKKSGKGLLLIGSIVVFFVVVAAFVTSPKVKKKRR